MMFLENATSLNVTSALRQEMLHDHLRTVTADALVSVLDIDTGGLIERPRSHHCQMIVQ